MAFDLSTAKPIDESSPTRPSGTRGFNLSTARPIDDSDVTSNADEGALVAAGRGAAEAVVPGFAGLAGFGAGMKAAAPTAARAAAATPGPAIAKGLVGGAVALTGGFAGAFGASSGAAWVQNKLYAIVDPEGYKNSQTAKEQHPTASAVGSVAGGLAGMSPKTIPEVAGKFFTKPIVQRSVSAGLTGTLDVGQQAATEDSIDWTRAGAAAAGGFAAPGFNPAGRAAYDIGGKLVPGRTAPGGGIRPPTDSTETINPLTPKEPPTPKEMETKKNEDSLIREFELGTNPNKQLDQAAFMDTKTGEYIKQGARHDELLKKNPDLVAGFLLKDGTFVTRKEAATIAKDQHADKLVEEIDPKEGLRSSNFGPERMDALKPKAKDAKYDGEPGSDLEIWKQKVLKLHKETSAAEKQSDPDTWTAQEKAAWKSKDWKEFSRLRGYSEKEIKVFQEYLDTVQEGVNKHGWSYDDIQSWELFGKEAPTAAAKSAAEELGVRTDTRKNFYKDLDKNEFRLAMLIEEMDNRVNSMSTQEQFAANKEIKDLEKKIEAARKEAPVFESKGQIQFRIESIPPEQRNLQEQQQLDALKQLGKHDSRKLDWEDTHDLLRGSKSATEGLQRIVDGGHASWPLVQLSKLLLKNHIISDAKVSVHDYEKPYTGKNAKPDSITLGDYDPTLHFIGLYKGGDIQTYIHETIHAAVYALQKDGTHASAKALKKLYEDYKSTTSERTQKNEYGLTDELEFLAEAFTNPKFQRLLHTRYMLGNPSKTMWQEFKDIVKDSLGIKKQNQGASALDQVLNHGAVLLEEGFVTSEKTSSKPTPTYKSHTEFINWLTGSGEQPSSRGASPESASNGDTGIIKEAYAKLKIWNKDREQKIINDHTNDYGATVNDKELKADLDRLKTESLFEYKRIKNELLENKNRKLFSELKEDEVVHYTPEENIPSILESGLDTTKSPKFSFGNDPTGKMGPEGTYYFTKDIVQWAFHGKERTGMSRVKATLKSNLNILTIDSIDAARKAGLDKDNVSDFISSAKNNGYDGVRFKYSKEGWRSDYDYGQWTGGSGKDDFLIFNKDSFVSNEKGNPKLTLASRGTDAPDAPTPAVDPRRYDPRRVTDEADLKLKGKELYASKGEAAAREFLQGYEKYKLDWVDPVKFVEDAVDINLNNQMAIRRNVTNNAERLKEMVPDPVTREQIAIIIDDGRIGVLGGPARALADKYTSDMKDIGERALKEGVVKGLLTDYVTHIVNWADMPKGALDTFLSEVFKRAGDPTKKTTTESRFGMERKIETFTQLERVLADINKRIAKTGQDFRLEIKTKDIAEIYKQYGLSMEKAIENKKLVESVLSARNPAGESLIRRVTDEAPLPRGWEVLNDRQFAGYAVHPDLAPALKFAFENKTGTILNGLYTVSQAVKRLNVIASFFHAKSLLEVQSSTGIPLVTPLKEVGLGIVDKVRGTEVSGIRKAVEQFKKGGLGDSVDKWIRGGLVLEIPQDVKIGVLGSIGKFTDSMIGKYGPKTHILESALTTTEKYTLGITDKVTWDYLHTGGKLYVADKYLERARIDHAKTEAKRIEKAKEVSDESLIAEAKKEADSSEKYDRGSDLFVPNSPKEKQIVFEEYYKKLKDRQESSLREQPFDEAASRKEITNFVNKSFGGLNWFQEARSVQNEFGKRMAMAAYSPEGRKYLQLLLFAPDWTISTIKAFTAALPKELNPLKMHPIEGIKGMATPSTQADYARLYQFKTALTYLTLLNGINLLTADKPIWENKDPTRIEFADGTSMQAMKHAMEPYHWLADPAKTLTNKLGFLPKAAIVATTGLEYPSPYAPKLVDPSAANRAVAILKMGLPFQASAAMSAPEGEGAKRALLGTLGVPVYGSTPAQKKAKNKERTKEINEKRKEYREREREAGR